MRDLPFLAHMGPFLVIFWVFELSHFFTFLPKYAPGSGKGWEKIHIYSSIERHFWFIIHDGSIYGFPTTKNYGHLRCISGNFHWWSVFIAHWSLCTSCPLFERCRQNPHVVEVERANYIVFEQDEREPSCGAEQTPFLFPLL